MAKLTRIHGEDGTGGSVNKDNITAIAVRSSFKQKERFREFRHGMSLCRSDQLNPEMVFTSLTATSHKGAILMFRLYGPNSYTMGGLNPAKGAESNALCCPCWWNENIRAASQHCRCHLDVEEVSNTPGLLSDLEFNPECWRISVLYVCVHVHRCVLGPAVD